MGPIFYLSGCRWLERKFRNVWINTLQLLRIIHYLPLYSTADICFDWLKIRVLQTTHCPIGYACMLKESSIIFRFDALWSIYRYSLLAVYPFHNCIRKVTIVLSVVLQRKRSSFGNVLNRQICALVLRNRNMVGDKRYSRSQLWWIAIASCIYKEQVNSPKCLVLL